MQCRYCQAWNESDERRCVRCGRRMDFHTPRAFATSTAPALDPLPFSQPEPQAQAQPKPHLEAPPAQAGPNYQPLLFRDPVNGPKVIPIPTLTPMRPKDEAPAKRAPRGPRNPSRHVSDSQQSLEFFDTHIEAQSGTPRSIKTQVEAVIYCDAPVALPAHRAIAAAFDAAMILSAVGVFLAIFFVSGGMIALTKENIPFFLGVGVVITLFYRFLFALADGDTPGMRFAGLRLVDFDGRKPDREQRGMRQIAGVLSLLSAGLGLVWALVDEENLTWHDHISKTFPTVG